MELHPSGEPVNRIRTRNLVIRLSDKEREMLDAVASREQMSASETVRWLVRREYEREVATGTKRGTKTTSTKGRK